VEFATKPELATKMITEALDAGIPARWASGDEVYGANPALASLEPVRLEPGWEGDLGY
jgi:SRSO17 transposase